MSRKTVRKVCHDCLWNCINGMWDAWAEAGSPYIPAEEMSRLIDACYKDCLAFHGINKCPPPD